MLYPFIEGSSDSRFSLAITFGLEDPLTAMAGSQFIEKWAVKRFIEHPIQMTVAITDGKTLWAFRYSSEGKKSRTLFFYSNDEAELVEE
jgi:glutamine amidotransferase